MPFLDTVIECQQFPLFDRPIVFFCDRIPTIFPHFPCEAEISDELIDGQQWDGETGFVHLAVDKHLEANIDRQAFLCGPPPMIEAVMRVLEDKGLAEQDIFYDKFN